MADAIRAADVEPKAVDWLDVGGLERRIPKGMLTVVAGKPDQGKGMFAAYVAAHASRAGMNVLYSAIEDDPRVMTRPRLEAAGANLDRILFWRFRLPVQGEELAAQMRENDIKLLVLDPFAAHLRGVSRHSDSIRDVLTPLSGLLEEMEAACIVVEHALKRISKNSEPLAAIGGTGSGLPAAARMAYIFGTDPDDGDRKILATAKSNLRDKPKSFAFEVEVDSFKVVGEMASLVPQGEVELDPMRLLVGDGDGTPGRKPDKRAAAAEWLTEHLAEAAGRGEALKGGAILEDAKQNGMTNKTVRRAADDMEVVKDPPGGGRNCTWHLPVEVLQALGIYDAKHPYTEAHPPEGTPEEQLHDAAEKAKADGQEALDDAPVPGDAIEALGGDEMDAELQAMLQAEGGEGDGGPRS